MHCQRQCQMQHGISNLGLLAVLLDMLTWLVYSWLLPADQICDDDGKIRMRVKS